MVESDRIVKLDPAVLVARDNNRRNFDHVPGLAESIAEQGQIEPITVRPLPGGRYLIVAGESRSRACEMLGIKVRAVVRGDLDDRSAFLITLSENDSRAQTNDIEKARGYSRAVEDFGLTVGGLASKLGKRVDYIERRLALLSLNDDIQRLVEGGQLGITYAAAMADAGLDSNFQRVAMRALNNNDSPRVEWFRRVCGELASKQAQQDMIGGLFGGGEDSGRMTSLLEDIEYVASTPPDPADFSPAFNPADPAGSLRGEISKWSAAGDKWDRYGDKRKAAECGRVVAMLRAMLQAVGGGGSAPGEYDSEADTVLRLLAERGEMTTRMILQYGNMAADVAGVVLDRLVAAGEIVRRRSGRGYRYNLASERKAAGRASSAPAAAVQA